MSLSEALLHAVAGTVGGILAYTALYPLEVIRTRLQVQVSTLSPDDLLKKDKLEKKLDAVISKLKSQETYTNAFDCAKKIIQKHGIRGLYSGLVSGIIGVGVSNAVYFFWYNLLKSLYQRWFAKKLGITPVIGPVVNMLIASLAGIINVFMTSPIWVVNTRLTLKTDESDSKPSDKSNESDSTTSDKNNVISQDVEDDVYKSVRDQLETVSGRDHGEKIGKKIKKFGIRQAFRQIIDEEGYQGLYKGLVPSLILVSNPATQFMVYEQLLSFLSRWKASHGQSKKQSSSPSSIEIFVIGAIAKAVATVLTYPYQVVKSRQQIDTSKTQSPSMLQLILKIYKEEGFFAFFKGMGVKLSQTVTNAAIMFIIYEKVFQIVKKMVLRVAI